MIPVSPLQGRKLLIVENDELNAQLMMFQLEDEGMEIIGPATSVHHAMSLLDDTPPDAVLLDYRLNGETSEPVLRRLEERATPYVMITGAVPERFEDRGASRNGRVLLKPFRAEQLKSALEEVIGAGVGAP